MKILRLILGDQLNIEHPWFQEKHQEDVLYTLMEVRPEQEYVKHHIQKIVGFFEAMRQFSVELSNRGFNTHYFKYDAANNQHSFEANLTQLIAENGIEKFEYQLPDEHRLDALLSDFSASLSIETNAVDTFHFLTSREYIQEFFTGKKTYLLESFYRHMRKKYNLMMEANGDPLGGKWNFDHQNRAKYKGEVPLPPPYKAQNNVSDVYKMVVAEKIPHFGEIEEEEFSWPVNRTQALEHLRYFLENGLCYFGTYEDAMTKEHETLFHSRLSFAMNIKLLSPLEIAESTIHYWQKHHEIPIQNVEGFIRQIIGWREYMRGVYWAQMPGYEEKNYFEHHENLPNWFWTGNTKMNCLKHAINGSLRNAWAHHMQRLMITGNFALLLGVSPEEVDTWYLGIYIDAIQWVEITNTRGMSQFADGGLVATKPYASTANYIHKMSDYCSGCHYKHTLKVEKNSCPFNSLYWDFFCRHEEKLSNNPRIGMAYRTWYKMDESQREKLLLRAAYIKEHVNDL